MSQINWTYPSNYTLPIGNTCPVGNLNALKTVSQTPFTGKYISKTILETPLSSIKNKYRRNFKLGENAPAIPDNYSVRTKFKNINILDKSTGTPITVIEPPGNRQQSTCGCCFAFAIASALGDRYAIKYSINNPILSPAWILANYISDKNLVGNPQNKCEVGGNILSVCNWIEKDGNGVKRESCWPFELLSKGPKGEITCPNSLSNIPNNCCLSCCHEPNDIKSQQKFYIQKGSSSPIYAEKNGKFDPNDIEIQNATIQAIQNEIIANGPVVSGFSVYKDFFYYWNNRAETGAVYIRDITTKDSNGNIPGLTEEGGHAVVITGWGTSTTQLDDYGKPLKYWEVRNSWGNSGDNGYGRIAFSTSVLPSKWVQIDIPEIKIGISISGGCVSFSAGDLPIPSNNYGETNTKTGITTGYVNYLPIFAPISMPANWPVWLRYLFMVLIGIFIIGWYWFSYAFLKHLRTEWVELKLDNIESAVGSKKSLLRSERFWINFSKITIITLGIIFAILYIIAGVYEKSFYGLFIWVNNNLMPPPPINTVG